MTIRQLRALLVRLAGAFSRDNQDREFAEELESHIQMHVDDNVRAGMTPEEARRDALVKLGGVEPTKELLRDQQRLPVAETLVGDLRYGMRRLAKSPGFTAIAVLSLTLGIGANTAVFSLINTAVLQPLPVERPDEIVSVTNAAARGIFSGFSYPNYRDYRDRNDVFDGLIAYRFAPLSVSHDGVNERLWGYVVSGNYFDVLGVRADRGRLIAPDDDRLPGAHPVAVVSYQSWRQRFGADPGIVGKDLLVNGQSYSIIGVAPEGFFGTEVIAAPELWFPMAMQAQIELGNSWLEERDVEPLSIQGRLEPGVTTAQADTALNAIAADLEREFPDANEGKRVVVTPPGFLGAGAMRGAVLGFTSILMVVVAIALLLACTNLANLLLARATDRRREIAVRLALGSSRARLVSQLMAESLLVAAVSGALGFLLASWLVDLAVAFKPPVEVPLAFNLHLDYRVLLFTCFVSLATGVLFGLLPSLQATKVDLLTALKDKSSFGGSRRSRLTSGLIVLQVALSLVLLVGGGLMIRALDRAQTMDLGYEPRNAVEVSFDLRLQGYDRDRGREFQKALLERVRSLPGVQYAGLVDLPPVDLHFSRTSIYVEGQLPEREGTAPRAMISRVGPGYFQAIGTPMVRGRDFGDEDDANAAPVAIVNETFARRFWPGEDPLGKRFSFSNTGSPQVEIVGVVRDGKYAGLNEEPQPYVCRPISQSYTGATSLIVRSDGEPRRLLAAVRGEVSQLDPQLPLSSAKSLVERLAFPLLPARLAASVLGSLGLVALALAAIGIYGVMSYMVSSRTQEIGVRMALGARAADVLRLAIGQGMKLVLIGVAIGVAAAWALTRLMKILLFGISAADPLTYGGVVALLIGVALFACYVPARRATKIDPMIALRNE
jgi:macrolide transport system ATP-binding/permease protein